MRKIIITKMPQILRTQVKDKISGFEFASLMNRKFNFGLVFSTIGLHKYKKYINIFLLFKFFCFTSINFCIK